MSHFGAGRRIQESVCVCVCVCLCVCVCARARARAGVCVQLWLANLVEVTFVVSLARQSVKIH